MWRTKGWKHHQKKTQQLKTHLKAASIFALFCVLLAWTGIGAQDDLNASNQALIEEQPAKTVVVEARQPATIEEKIIEYADLAFFPRDVALEVGMCESSLNPNAQNPNSSAKGLYQFISSTWDWIEAEGSPFDPDENIKQFIKWYPIYPSWWSECL